MCIYLTGSLLSEEPLIGGATDIDLIFVHDGEPPLRREIVHLVDEVHLDIGHFSQTDFAQPRQLRQDPWLGPFIASHPLLLHDSAHWFDFTQATITSQFNYPENTLARARALAGSARQAWMQLRQAQDGTAPAGVWMYLKALEDAGNAFASLTGSPLAERRFWLGLAGRAAELNRPEPGQRPVGAAPARTGRLLAAWQAWQLPWQSAFTAAGDHPACPPRLHPARRAYYERAAAALVEIQPAPAAWLALRTWTQAAALLPLDFPDFTAWQSAIETIGLAGAGFSARLDAFDAYLDHLEEALDEWGKASGI